MKARVRTTQSISAKVSTSSSSVGYAEKTLRVQVSTQDSLVSKLSGIHKTVAAVGIQGPAGAVIDLDLSGLEDGSVLVYHSDTGKWVAQTLLNKQQIDMGDESF